MTSTGLKALKIGLIPGDGIGRLVIPAAQRVLQSTPGIPKPSFINLEAGFELFTKTGVSLPQETVKSLREDCTAALFGAVSSPSHKVEGYSSPIVKLRKELDLYANIRPIHSNAKSLEITVVRENTECLYIKQETLNEQPDALGGGKVALAVRQITQRASERIGRMAGEVALRGAEVRSQLSESERIWKGPSKVTIVHKSNVLSVSDGLFRESVRSIFDEKRYPKFKSIEVDEGIVDSLIYNLIRTPQKFNVLVCPNLYGDIVSDAGAALVGSLGLVPSVNAGDHFIMGEPVHGSAPDIVNHSPSIANPMAAIRSAAMMLEYLGYTKPASVIYSAVNAILDEGKILTPDLGGKSSTDEVTDAILKKMS
ncbi:hypothetical protein DFH28DRAFT_965379 [Melampsora americana]|nr:hypothetical protein DFH28DRAFT_965379 [Melampsora americana]